MGLLRRMTDWLKGKEKPLHLRLGELGEKAARRHLQGLGLKFLVANYRSGRGEIDLVFRDGEALVFVEVKARSNEDWSRPAAAVDREKRRLLGQTAQAYLKAIGRPKVAYRFDIVEVLLEQGEVREIRHWPHAFKTMGGWRKT